MSTSEHQTTLPDLRPILSEMKIEQASILQQLEAMLIQIKLLPTKAEIMRPL